MFWPFSPPIYASDQFKSIRKIINFWYTFGWKWWVISFRDYLGLSDAYESLVFLTIWDCQTHVPKTSMMSSVERTDLDFKISVALISMHMQNSNEIRLFILKILSKSAFWTWIKGHNYAVSELNYPTCNSIPLLSDTNVYAMHMQNFIEDIDQKCILDINQGP